MAAPKAKAAHSLRQRLYKARLEAALTGTGSAVLLGFVIIASAATYVLGLRGFLRAEAWMVALGAGAFVMVIKVGLDLIAPTADTARLRRVLFDAFGDDMRNDAELSRQARQAIEFRVRLAEAEERADGISRRRVSAILVGIDTWMDGIVRLAHEVATHRGEANFQSGLASKARERRKEMQSRATKADGDMALTRQLRGTIDGLDRQITAAADYARFVEAGRLKLESSVAAFGAINGQVIMALADGRVPEATLITARISEETAAIERHIARIAEQDVPALPRPDQIEAAAIS